MKFRSEVLIGNTTFRESLDFYLELEGVPTGIEVLIVLAPTFSVGILLFVNFRIQKRMNKVFWEDVRFYNTWLYLLLYLFSFRWISVEKKERRRNRRIERNLNRQNRQVNRRNKRSTPKETTVQENKREVLFYAQENLSKEKPEVEEECAEGKNSLKLFSKMIHFK